MLTEKQIQYLDDFCKKKGIKYYDLRLEMVDHLAACIEEKSAAKSSFNFENTLEEVYKNFGIFGFTKIIDEKEEAIADHAKKIKKQLLISYFSWPRIALVILGALFNYSVLFHMNSSWQNPILWGLLLFYIGTFIYGSIQSYLKKHSLKEPILGLKSLSFDAGILGVILGFTYIGRLFLEGTGDYRLLLENVRLFISFSLLQLYIVYYIGQMKIKNEFYQKAQQQYPLAFKN